MSLKRALQSPWKSLESLLGVVQVSPGDETVDLGAGLEGVSAVVVFISVTPTNCTWAWAALAAGLEGNEGVMVSLSVSLTTSTSGLILKHTSPSTKSTFVVLEALERALLYEFAMTCTSS